MLILLSKMSINAPYDMKSTYFETSSFSINTHVILTDTFKLSINLWVTSNIVQLF